jgi:hypothetical protein
VGGVGHVRHRLPAADAGELRAIDARRRGRAIGVAASGIIAAQGAAVLVGGLLADLWDPTSAVAVAGAIGMVLSVGGAAAWWRATASRRVPVGVAGG